MFFVVKCWAGDMMVRCGKVLVLLQACANQCQFAKPMCDVCSPSNINLSQTPRKGGRVNVPVSREELSKKNKDTRGKEREREKSGYSSFPSLRVCPVRLLVGIISSLCLSLSWGFYLVSIPRSCQCRVSTVK